MALYYENLEVGARYTTAARTVTESDLVTFAMLSGDWNPIHTDEEFAKQTHFGRRIVHGLFGVSLLTGLVSRAGWFDGSAIAMLGIRDWQFKAPIFVGDTLHCVMQIVSKRITSAGDRGVVDRRFQLLNQREEVVQEGSIALMVRLSRKEVQGDAA